MPDPTLSVVVIGRNEGERLTRCLQSVHAMHHPSLTLEIIYIDSSSTDDSVQRAEASGAHVITLDTDRPNAAKARNAGWRAASGTTVLFLDGDTVLHPDFVAQAMPAFNDARNDLHVAVVWGHRRELFPERSVYQRVMDLDWIYAPGPAAFCGGDALFRRDVLRSCSGFNEALIAGEEPELCRRIIAQGGTVLHVDLPMTGHDLAITRFAQYWKRAVRAGHAYAEVSAMFRGTSEGFWTDEVTRNRRRALTLIAIPTCGVLSSAAMQSVVPFLVATLLLLALTLRSAWKARWKSSNAWTLFLYGIHSHFQQIPIYAGQLRFQRGTHARQLVEYK